MRTFPKIILAGGAVAALAAVGAVAAENSHVLTVRLPDGSQEQIRYSGDVVPGVRIVSGPRALFGFAPVLDSFGPDSPFAAIQRMSAAMDRQAAQMLSASRMVPFGAGGLRTVDLASLPAGTHAYTVVSTYTGGKLCTRTTEMSGATAAAPARILTRASGDCGPAKIGQPSVIAAPVMPAVAAPVLTRTGYDAARRSPPIAD